MELDVLELEDVLVLNSWKEFPRTWQKREELEVEVLKASATLEEFFYLLEKTDYKIEYFHGEIYSFMGQASIPHETLVGILITYLSINYLDLDEFRILSSNAKIYAAECNSAFNADVTVVKGDVDYLTLKSGKKSKATLTNPHIVVEILSDSTKGFDFGDKLSCYKTIPSLQQILFIDQDSVYISSYVRTNDPHEWINHDYYSLEETLKLVDFDLKISDIYRKVLV